MINFENCSMQYLVIIFQTVLIKYEMPQTPHSIENSKPI